MLQKLKKFSGKLLKWSIITLFIVILLVIGLVASLSLPPVQSRLVKYARVIAESQLNTKVEIGFVDFGLPKWAILKNVVIYDKQNYPALQLKALKIGMIDFPFRRLIYDLYHGQSNKYTISVKEIELQTPDIYLYKRQKDSTLNLLALLPKSTDTTKTESPFKFDIKLYDISIENGHFRFIDSTKTDFMKLAAPRMNYSNIDLVGLNLMAEFNLSANGVLDLHLQELQANELNSNLKIKHLHAIMHNVGKEVCDDNGKTIELPHLKVDSLALIAGKTNLQANIVFPKHGLEQIASGDSTILQSRNTLYIADIRQSSFDFSILDHFIPPIPVRGVVDVQGHAEGSFTGIQHSVLKAKYGKDIALEGNLRLLNWDKGDDMWFDINIRKGSVSGDELGRLLPEVKFPDFFPNIKKSDLKGSYIGRYFDFKTNLELKTPLGLAAVDMKIFIPMKKPDDIFLDGDFRTEHLNLDKIAIVPNQKLSTDITSKGYFKGKYYDFYTKTEATVPQGQLAVDMKIFIPMKKPEDLTLDGNFSTQNLNFDALGFLPERKISDNITSKGYFKGHFYDFYLKADAATSIGSLICDVNVKIPPFGNIKEYEYKGYVDVHNFNLDAMALTPDPISKSLTFKGYVDGHGIDFEKLGVQYDGSVANTTIMGYQIDNLEGKFAVQNKVISGRGNFKGGKTNVKADSLFLDLNQKHYVFTGDVQNFDLKQYKLYDKEHISISSEVDADLTGNDIDHLVGVANVNDAKLTFFTRNKFLDIKTLSVDKRLISDSSYIAVDGSLGKGLVSGYFKFADFEPRFNQFYEEIKLFLINDDSLMQHYYNQKTFVGNPLKLHLSYKPEKEINKIFEFFDQPIYVAAKSVLAMHLNIPNIEKSSESLQLNYLSDSTFYDSYSVKKPDVVIALTKDARPLKIDATNIVVGSNIKYKHFYVLKCINPKDTNCHVFSDTASFVVDTSTLRLTWDGDVITTNVKTQQDKTGFVANFSADSRFFLDGKIISQFAQGSKFIVPLKDKTYQWEMLEGNQITSFPIKKYFIFSNLGVYEPKLNQTFVADGILSKDREDTLRITANNVGLDLINQFASLDFGYELDGNLNAKVYLQNIFETPIVHYKGIFQDFTLDGFKYGNISADGDWRGEQERVNLKAKLLTATDTLLDLSGHYDYGIDNLDFNLSTVTELPLTYITPFVKDQLFDLSGGVQVKAFNVSGKSSSPQILGKGSLKNAGFGVSFFKTKFIGNGEVNFDIDRMEISSLKPIILEDETGHTAEFYGAIYHKGLKDFQFDLQLRKIADFLVMNLKKEDKNAFYGPVIIKDGLASISGSLQKLEIDAFGITGKGSHLYIPISDNDAGDKPDYIHFIGEKNLLNSKKTDVLGIDVNLNIQATEDAWVELIFDEKLGDIIKGRGNGTLQMNLTQQGDFFMYGTYEIVQGDYLFTVQNFVNKKFFVKPGGTITWNGDPFNARLNMQAYYPVYTNIQPVLNTTQPLRTNVNVLMNLEGDLMKPNIGLSIEPGQTSSSSSDLGTDLSAYLKTISYDQQELNKQVFFLLTTGQFVPAGSGVSNAGNLGVSTAINSVSELLSNQLNNLLAKSTGSKLNVAVGSNTFTDVTLQISANLFNDRVTIERDGTLVGQNTNFSVGNVSIKTKLRSLLNDSTAKYNDRKGDWIFEVFYRNNQTGQLTGGNQTGAGVFYKNDFDSFSDLFRKRKKKKK